MQELELSKVPPPAFRAIHGLETWLEGSAHGAVIGSEGTIIVLSSPHRNVTALTFAIMKNWGQYNVGQVRP